MAPSWVEEAAVLAISPTKTVTFIMGELVSVATTVTLTCPRTPLNSSP